MDPSQPICAQKSLLPGEGFAKKMLRVSPATSDDRAFGPALMVGDWRVDAARNQVSRADESAHLEPKAIEVLVYLARRAGLVVAREELLAAVWPGVIVGDDVLTQAVIKLRKALGDEARRPTYIETISKRGYRLVAPVSEPGRPATGPPASPARWPRWPLVAVAGAALALAVAMLVPWSPAIGARPTRPRDLAADDRRIVAVQRKRRPKARLFCRRSHRSHRLRTRALFRPRRALASRGREEQSGLRLASSVSFEDWNRSKRISVMVRQFQFG
jgi:DNA-binding winged helix-turn-helix (wHTH) protein